METMSILTPEASPTLAEIVPTLGATLGVSDQAALLESLLPRLSRNQQRYLVARLDAESHAAAMQSIGLEANTRERWKLEPAFAEAERVLLAMGAGSRATYARIVAQMAAPTVMHRQVEQATESHEGLSDRQLMAQQRARASVLDAAGVTSPTNVQQGDIERIDIMAVRIMQRRKQAQLQPPT